MSQDALTLGDTLELETRITDNIEEYGEVQARRREKLQQVAQLNLDAMLAEPDNFDGVAGPVKIEEDAVLTILCEIVEMTKLLGYLGVGWPCSIEVPVNDQWPEGAETAESLISRDVLPLTLRLAKTGAIRPRA